MNESTGKRKAAIIASVIVIMVILMAGLALVTIIKHNSHGRATRLYSQGLQKLEEQAYDRAFELFVKATAKSPLNPHYYKGAARAAFAQGQWEVAEEYAQLAWEKGLKDFDLYEIIESSQSRLNENPDAETRLTLLADIARTSPLRTPDDKVRIARQGMDELSEIKEASLSDGDHLELRGDIYFHFERVDEAIPLWLEALQTNPTPELVTKTARALWTLKREEDDPIALLQEFQKKEMLNSEGYALLANLLGINDQIDEVDSLFADAKRHGQYDDSLKLEHASFELIRERLDSAEAILRLIPEVDPSVESELDDTTMKAATLRHHKRLMLSYIHLKKKNAEGIAQLMSYVDSVDREDSHDKRWIEAEQRTYGALLALLAGEENVVSRLAAARTVAGTRHPIIEVVYADLCLQAKDYAEASAACENIRGIFRLWPVRLLIMAEAEKNRGKIQHALRIMQYLHERGQENREFLQMYQDLLLTFGNVPKANEQANELQDEMEQLYPNDVDVAMRRGAILTRTGQFEEAARLYETLSERFPDEPKLKLGFIDVLLEQRDFDEALAACDRAQADPAFVSPLRARALAGLERFEEAEKEFARAMELDPDRTALVHYQYGYTLLLANKLDLAREQLLKAVAIEPTMTNAHVGLARIAFQQSAWDRCIEHSQTALTLDPTLYMPNVFLGKAFAANQNLSDAIQQLEEALRKQNDLQPALQVRADIYAAFDTHREQARNDYRKLLELNPGDQNIKRKLGLVLVQLGEFQSAGQLTAELLQAEPDNPGNLLLDLELKARQGKFDEAFQVLERGQETLGEIETAVLQADLFTQQNDLASAVALLEKHLDRPETAAYYAKLQLQQRSGAKAVAALKPHSFSARTWGELAGIAERHDQLAAAAYCYKRGIDTDKNNFILLNNWAWNEIQQPEFDAAQVIDACRKARELAPRSAWPSILDTYSEALLRSGRYVECQSLLVRQGTITDRSQQLLINLGRAYQEAGQPVDAIRTYEKFLALASTESGKETQTELRQSKEEVVNQIAELKKKQQQQQQPE